jgi:plastocyanin
LSACGKDAPKPASSGDPTTSSTESTTSTTEAAAAPASSSVAVTATEYAYALEGGTTIPAGQVTIDLTNDGKEEHQVSIARLRDGKTFEDFAALGQDPSKFAEVVETFGGPNAAAPGGTSSATQVLEPGDYIFACFIPGPDGVPHAAKGMIAPVTVEGDSVDAAEPGEDAIALKEYAFGADEGGIDAGTWTFVNEGKQPHEAAIYAPADGKTVDDVIAYFKDPAPQGPPPVKPSGGIGPLDPGKSGSVELLPGDYVFMCFLPDAGDGAPHFAHGMIQAVTVK